MSTYSNVGATSRWRLSFLNITSNFEIRISDFRLKGCSMPRQHEGITLRRGYTTGACAAAAARAAWSLLRGAPPSTSIQTLFPDDVRREMRLAFSTLESGTASVGIVKDAGDDPDSTDKALITVTIAPFDDAQHTEKDYEFSVGSARFILRGGAGVGLSTRDGLDAPKGKWAINPTPRKMIHDNIADAAAPDSSASMSYLVVIEVADGELLAAKTLNPSLGIIGGISILGTTGFVEPYSNKAYIDTVKILLRNAARIGQTHVALTTGARTESWARKRLSDLPEHAFIRIGDFIQESIEAAGKVGLARVTVACMPGKLLKYAQGREYTHAHKAPQQVAALAPLLQELEAPPEVIRRVSACPSVREAFNLLDAELTRKVLEILVTRASRWFAEWSAGANVSLLVFDSDGNLLAENES